MTGTGPGVEPLLRRLEIGPIPLGFLYLPGCPWGPADVEWLRSRCVVEAKGDRLQLVRKDGTR